MVSGKTAHPPRAAAHPGQLCGGGIFGIDLGKGASGLTTASIKHLAEQHPASRPQASLRIGAGLVRHAGHDVVRLDHKRGGAADHSARCRWRTTLSAHSDCACGMMLLGRVRSPCISQGSTWWYRTLRILHKSPTVNAMFAAMVRVPCRYRALKAVWRRGISTTPVRPSSSAEFRSTEAEPPPRNRAGSRLRRG